MKKSLSIVILTKNEEQQIEKALKSAAFSDEVIVIDSGSSDKTLSLVKKYTKKIYSVKFTDFSELRNFGKEQTTGEWLFYLDADEEIPANLESEIANLLQEKNTKAAYYILRTNYYLGRKWPTKDRMQRLFLKSKLLGWYGKVHETPKVDGQTGQLTNSLIHKTHNNLEEMLVNTLVWSEFEATQRLKNNHPPIVGWRILRVMITAFWESYIKQKGYQVGTEGLI